MFLSSDIDIDAVLTEFERVSLLGAIQINDKKLTALQWDEIDEDEKEGLMTKYFSFFISPLVMKSF